MRHILLIICLMASQAFGQVAMSTPRVTFLQQSSSNNSVAVNSSNPVYAVLNQPMQPGASCVSTPIGNKPAVVQQYDPYNWTPATVFNTNMGSRYTYPSNVNITQLVVRICYHINGTVNLTGMLVPILKDTSNGNIYEPENGGVLILAGTYSPGSTTAATSYTVNWNLSGFPLSSNDLNNGRFEFGYRVRLLYWYYPPIISQAPDGASIRVHSMDWRGHFVSTPLTAPTVAPAATISYSGTILTVSQPVAQVPSAATDIRVSVICPDGLYHFSHTVPWGTQGPYVTSYNFVNTSQTSPCFGIVTPQNPQFTRAKSELVINGSVLPGTESYSPILYY